ncbi:type II secretion system protein GspD [Synechococcus sp. UW105]|uniref:type II secretion system protein GspD n=1 Tax=Synechococcus sp. UW105 TaxID=337067 RepID=UPI000E0ED90F|nr:type II and III secretion system protein [Synechococcus sp. UW105]
MTSSRRLTPLVLALALGGACLDGVALAWNGSGQALAQSQHQGSMQLTLRRQPNALEVVLEGVGSKPLLQQRLNDGVWEGRLQTQGTPGLRRGPQTLSLPSLGIEAVSLSGGGDTYRVTVRQATGQSLKDPVVSADGRNLILTFDGLGTPQLQTGRLDLNTPGRVSQQRYAPPLRPRAIAPPLGDMAVGTMVLQNRSYVNVSGPSVTLTLKDAPAKDALMALARLGGYGFVFVDDPGGADAGATDASAADSGADAQAKTGRPVSIAFQNESYSRALNGVLLASGLQGKLDDRTLLIGPTVAAKTFGPQMSKVIRLNQVSARAAAEYLGNLGATVNFTNTVTVTSGEPASQGTADISNATSQEKSTITQTESYGASTGPLRGLVVTTDSRLQTVTLVSDSKLVKIAEGYLRQIDLRQRQVALSVRILDVTLDNDAAISNSFAFRYGNNFIVSDRGELVGAFGNLLPPNDNNFNAIAGDAQSGKRQRITSTGADAQVAQEILEPLDPARVNPGTIYPKDNFFDLIKALIMSNSAKTLASPTLILSETPREIAGGAEVSSSGGDSALNNATIGRPRANESFVTVGTREIVSYAVQAGQNGAPNTCQPEFGTAGLAFGARVSKIDDNGFISFALSPAISAVTRTTDVPNCGPISILSSRRLDTGSLRVRDGQTLILTGVISDSDIQQVRKWPILGDLPLIGQFFRQSNGSRRKNELVILVTPRIIDDQHGGTYGYGYQPSIPAARQLTGSSY